MSGKLVGMVFDHFPKVGGGGDLLLAVKLADNAHEDGKHIYPSVATLAQQTGKSERTVQYQLRRLVDSGWLMLVREAVGGGRGGGYGRPREYRIHPDWIRAHDARMPEDQRPAWPPVTHQSGDASQEMGAEIAPIKKKWVQPSVEMGAIAIAEMGATAVAPYPPLTVKEPIPPVSPTGDSPAFERLVQIWPAGRRQRQEEARAEFDRIIANGLATAAELLDSANAQASDAVWSRDGGRFVPLLRTWLRGGRWKDGRGMAEQATWHESRAGVEGMGERLGIGRWDRAAFSAGMGEAWPSYRQRVVQAAAGCQARVPSDLVQVE